MDIHFEENPFKEIAFLQTDLACLRAFMEQEDFSGVVLIAPGTSSFLHQERGRRSLPEGPLIRLDAQFGIGSLGKMFTAVAILQLLQQGRLGLHTTVGELLSDYSNREAHSITVHQLLTHSSGLGDVFGDVFGAIFGDVSGSLFLQHRESLQTPQDFLDLFGSQKLLFAPGERFSYSNLGYMLLGRMVERVSGESYDHFVVKHIFQPCQMSSSGFDFAEATRLAIGYTQTDQGLIANLDLIPVRGTPTGGCFSTAEDLLRFARALLEQRLLDPATTTLMTKGKIETPDQQLYGYGCRDRSIRGVRWFGHSGGGVGTNTTLRIFPDAQAVLIVLSNRSPPMADKLADFVMGGASDR